MSFKEFTFKVKEFVKKHKVACIIGVAIFMFLIITPPLCGCQVSSDPESVIPDVSGTYIVTEGYVESAPDDDIATCEDIEGMIFSVNKVGDIVLLGRCMNIASVDSDGIVTVSCDHKFITTFYGTGIESVIDGNIVFDNDGVTVELKYHDNAPKAGLSWTDTWSFRAKPTNLPWKKT